MSNEAPETLNVPLALTHFGAVTPIGADAQESCFAYRAGAVGLRECPILDGDGKPTTVSSNPTFDPYLQGHERRLALTDRALVDLFANGHEFLRGRRLRLHLLLDEGDPSDSHNNEALAQDCCRKLQSVSGMTVSQKWESTGASGLGSLLCQISSELAHQRYDASVLVSVHTDYDKERIQTLSQHARLYSPDNLDGVLPGEAACAMVLCSSSQVRAMGQPPFLMLEACQSAIERARWNNDESAFEATALTVAARKATEQAHLRGQKIGWLSSDTTMEMFRSQELQAVLTRLQPRLQEPQCLEMPGQRIGNLGASSGPFQLIYAAEAHRRGFAPATHLLCLLGSEKGGRCAVLASRPDPS